MTAFPQRADHPRHCQGCDGTGWQAGPPIPSQQPDGPFTYTTVEPCTHIWWDDDPNPDLFTRDQLEKA